MLKSYGDILLLYGGFAGQSVFKKLISNNDDDKMTIILFTMTAKTQFY